MEALIVYPKLQPHALLRARMYQLGADGKFMAKKLGIAAPTFSQRMTGRTPWSVDEMYDVMHILKIPVEQMHEFFPDMRKGR